MNQFRRIMRAYALLWRRWQTRDGDVAAMEASICLARAIYFRALEQQAKGFDL